MAPVQTSSTVGSDSSKVVKYVGLGVAAGVAVAGLGYYYYQRRKRQNRSALGDDDLPDVKGEGSIKLGSLDMKNKGNELFKAGRYAEAVQMYTDAIDEACTALSGEEAALCGGDTGDSGGGGSGSSGSGAQASKKDIAAFYQNRAAAYEKLKKPEKVIEDCTTALSYNKSYPKAILRRAKANQQMGNMEASLIDYTAGCVLENFQSPVNLEGADTVLRALAAKKAADLTGKREVEVPISRTFVESYLSSFCEDPIMNALPKVAEFGGGDGDDDEPLLIEGIKDEKDIPKDGFAKAQASLVAKDYADVIPACTEEIACKNSEKRAEALLLRATFYLIMGQGKKALLDFEELFKELELAPDNKAKKFRANAYIKRGSLHMQQNHQAESREDFSLAEQTDPENADVYHHRGQLLVLLDELPKATADFDRSVQLRPDFDIAVVQRCFCLYQSALASQNFAEVDSSMKHFEKVVEEHPNCAEGFALIGQAYMQQQKFQEADTMFTKASKLAPYNANIYVHRGLLYLQWREDVEKAIEMIKKAIDIDPNCEFAFETIGTLELHRGNIDAAIDYFDKGIAVARTEFELAHIFTSREAATAQKKVMEEFGIIVPSMVSPAGLG